MITVAEVLASFILAKHLWEEFAMLRGGCSGWCPNPRPLFASFTGEKNLTGSVFYILEGNPGQGESPKKFIVI